MYSASNLVELSRGLGRYVLAVPMRRVQDVDAEVLTRPGRYRPVADNLQVKEVWVGDGERRKRYVLCVNPQEAERQRHHRQQVLMEIDAGLAADISKPVVMTGPEYPGQWFAGSWPSMRRVLVPQITPSSSVMTSAPPGISPGRLTGEVIPMWRIPRGRGKRLQRSHITCGSARYFGPYPGRDRLAKEVPRHSILKGLPWMCSAPFAEGGRRALADASRDTR
jgi:hypothetical protein